MPFFECYEEDLRKPMLENREPLLVMTNPLSFRAYEMTTSAMTYSGGKKESSES